MSEQWSFIKSNRFWAIVIGAVALALYTEGVLPEAYFKMVTTIVAAFVGVRTVDRFSEQISNKSGGA